MTRRLQHWKRFPNLLGRAPFWRPRRRTPPRTREENNSGRRSCALDPAPNHPRFRRWGPTRRRLWKLNIYNLDRLWCTPDILDFSHLFNYHFVDSSYYDIIKPSYNHISIVSYHHIIKLSYSHIIKLSFYHAIILYYYRMIKLSHHPAIRLSSFHIIILSYNHIPYHRFVVLSH